MLVGVALGLYVGIWLMFVGGIIGIVNVVAETMQGIPINAYAVGINVAKIIFASFVGVISFYVLAIPGWLLIFND